MGTISIIDTLEPAGPRRYFAKEGQIVRINRLNGKTQIKSGVTTPEALAYWGLAYEVVTAPANADDVLQDPQQVDGIWTTVWVPRVYTESELNSMRLSAVQQLNAHIESIVQAKAALYPDFETKTWDVQEAEARAWDADPNAATPYIDILLTGRYGAENVAAERAGICGRIIANADAYRALGHTYAGICQAHRAAIYGAQTKADIDAALVAALAVM